MTSQSQIVQKGAQSALWLATLAFTASFAVWTIFSIIGIRIKQDLGLSETQFGLLLGTPILTGSLIRLVLGVWTERFGGKIINPLVMLAAAASAYLLASAHTYPQFLIAALGLGLAGGTFAVGVAYVSKFFASEKQGMALGIFGAGNVGATVTILVAPIVMVAMGWQAVAQIWAGVLAALAVAFFVLAPEEPDIAARRARRERAPNLAAQFAVLKNLQVWRFSLYYFFVFGGFVALSLWLPRYLVGAYQLDIRTAGLVAIAFSAPAGLFRIFGGHLADKFGARKVMYWTFSVAVIASFLLSYPPTTYIVDGVTGPISFRLATSVPIFGATIFVLGIFMSFGSAAVFKHIPTYYPQNVGAVGGLVGAVGGLGGFVLPIGFGILKDTVGVWTSCFMLLFVLVAIALLWMHFAIRNLERRKFSGLRGPKDLPELEEAIEASRRAAAAMDAASRALEKAKVSRPVS